MIYIKSYNKKKQLQDNFSIHKSINCKKKLLVSRANIERNEFIEIIKNLEKKTKNFHIAKCSIFFIFYIFCIKKYRFIYTKQYLRYSIFLILFFIKIIKLFRVKRNNYIKLIDIFKDTIRFYLFLIKIISILNKIKLNINLIFKEKNNTFV